MLSIREIETYYPESLRAFKRNLMREYLQYKILEIIFNSPQSQVLSFLGGTAVRIVHGNCRFSEDLDFDNWGLDEAMFKVFTREIGRKLELEGYQVEIGNVFKRAFHCYVRIPGILFESGLSQHGAEKVLIRIDTEQQGFDYSSEQVILNKFEVFCRIRVTPAAILLSQKIFAIFNRSRKMGRDFFDALFLFGKTRPDFGFLQFKLDIHDMDCLKKRLLDLCEELDFKALARDVEPFLASPTEAEKVLGFHDYVRQL